ncbi:unnamed protein product [Phytophthora fragariaefolia]|uniref:Unnamed protein product n=1 Tax=Phytophthora fragariaefolia TaxID=1490495 RepID=A0A9W7CWQ1_9STRA|nr:unnamed protein product [Phytophthora fragariaefolia]
MSGSNSRPSSPDATSTTAAPSRTRPSSGFVAPVVDLAPVGAEPNSLRSALGILSTALERTEAYDTLRADHAALQQAYLASPHRVEALEAEILADSQNALAKRLDNAREISDAQERLAFQQRVHEDAVKDFHNRIDQLERQVAALESSTDAVSPQSPRSIQLLEAEVAKARAGREAMAIELQQSRDINRALEAFQQALESSVSKLRRQVDALEHRAVGLRDERDRQRDQLQARLRRTEAARDQLRDEVDRLTAQLSTATDEMHRAVASRNQTATELRSARNRPQERSRRRGTHSSSAGQGSTHRTSPPPNTTPGSASSGAPPPSGHFMGSGRPSDPPAESSEDEVLAVLARTRSAQRRSDRADSRGSTPSLPIAVDDSANSTESNSADRAELRGPASVPATLTPASGRSRVSVARGRDPSECSPDGEQVTGGEPSGSGAGHNQLVPDAALASLPATRIPRDRWLPGYRVRQQYQASDVAPWPLPDVLACSVLEMTVDTLFRHFSCPLGWLYPRRSQTSTPSQTTWLDSLVTEGNLVALFNRQPWEALNSSIIPMSFDMVGEFKPLVTAYIAFEDEHRQAYWESSHAIPISPAMRDATPALAQYYTARMQRRARVGARWKSFLRQILRGMVAGHWDIDILLDPFSSTSHRRGNVLLGTLGRIPIRHLVI